MTEFPLETSSSCAAVLKNNHRTLDLGLKDSFSSPTDSPSLFLSTLFKRRVWLTTGTFIVELGSQFLHLVPCNKVLQGKDAFSRLAKGCKRPGAVNISLEAAK